MQQFFGNLCKSVIWIALITERRYNEDAPMLYLCGNQGKERLGYEMDLKEIMQQKRFVVVGDTLNREKAAYEIKHSMQNKGYIVSAVGKELNSINDVEGEIDIIDLCIHPTKGLALMQECQKPCKCVVIQPGAGSEALISHLQEKNIPYLESCLLIGLHRYAERG